MKQNELFSYAYDFVSQMLENKEIFDTIRKIILFGSVVRGDFTKNSDVDIFVDVNSSANPKKINDLVKKEINKFETRAEKTWAIRGINLPLKVIADDINKEKWKDLQEELLSYGKLIYGKFEILPENCVHKIIVTYNINLLPQKKKMSFLRKLYGYKLRKGKKEYIQKGLINEISCEKLNSGALLLVKDDWLKVKKLLCEYKINYLIRDAWMK